MSRVVLVSFMVFLAEVLEDALSYALRRLKVKLSPMAQNANDHEVEVKAQRAWVVDPPFWETLWALSQYLHQGSLTIRTRPMASKGRSEFQIWPKRLWRATRLGTFTASNAITIPHHFGCGHVSNRTYVWRITSHRLHRLGTCLVAVARPKMLEPFRGCQGLWGCAVLTRQHAFWAFLAFAVVAFQILYKSFYKVLSKSCVTCVTVAFI